MSWKDLLQKEDEKILAPWTGGRSFQLRSRCWEIIGRLPSEEGWYWFSIQGRKAEVLEKGDPTPEALLERRTGYLVGDCFISDAERVDPDPKETVRVAEVVHILDPGLGRFVRIEVGRAFDYGPLVFSQLTFPIGVEDEVLEAYLNRLPSVTDIRGVTPALDASFRMETFHREEVERQRAELERLRLEEEARLAREQRRQELFRNIGDSQARRELARTDFQEAARRSLAIGGASYLDSRPGVRRGEFVVQYRFLNRRFECICNSNLQIVDSGICLQAHSYDDEVDQDGFAVGTRGDAWLSLESLPSVVREASNAGRLVVYRHVD